MPDPKQSGEEPAKRSARNQAKTEAAGATGPEPEHAKADRSQREPAGEELCSRLGGAPGLDPALMLCQAMALAGYSASQADALMFYNAVANQQKTNILGMSVTAKCVRYMFEIGEAGDEDNVDILEEALWPRRPRRGVEGRDDGEL